MVFGKKSKPEEQPAILQGGLDVSGDQAARDAVTISRIVLIRERENLTREQQKLAELQKQLHLQHAVIAHCRENIALLEDHPWFDALYAELRQRETKPNEPPKAGD